MTLFINKILSYSYCYRKIFSSHALYALCQCCVNVVPDLRVRYGNSKHKYYAFIITLIMNNYHRIIIIIIKGEFQPDFELCVNSF